MPASRLTLWSMAALIALVLAGAPIAGLLPERISFGNIVFRPWMIVVNGILAGTHGAALAALWLGLRSHPGSRAVRWSLAVGALASIGGALFPVLIGAGPYLHGDWQMDLLRSLVFLPALSRAVAWLGLAVGLGAASRLRPVLVLAFGADLLWSLSVFVGTPLAVMARLHVSPATVWILVPWALAGVALLYALRRVPLRA